MPRLFDSAPAFALAGILLIASPAAAQLFSDNTAREASAKNAADVENLKRALAQVNQNANKALADAQSIRRQFSAAQTKIQQLESRNRALQGATEEAKHAANAAAEAARQLLEEFRAQTAKLAAAELELERVSALAAALETRSIQRDSHLAEQAELTASLMLQIGELGQFAEIPSEQELYEAASGMFQKRDYENALNSFRRVLRFYPSGQFSEGARYWEAAALFFLGRHEAAAEAARTLAQTKPDSDKRPDAELILARALNALGDGASARTVLEGIIQNDPASLAADKARQLLADIAPADSGASSGGE